MHMGNLRVGNWGNVVRMYASIRSLILRGMYAHCSHVDLTMEVVNFEVPNPPQL